MAPPTRNGPCSCGSGIKYKKCCLPKETVPVTVVPARSGRIVERRGRQMYASRGISATRLDAAADHFARRDRREGPGAQIMRFARPLLDAAGDEPDRMKHAVNHGMAFWNLALCTGDRYERLLATMANEMGDHADKFRGLAAEMVERHRTMFPELHGGPT